MFAGLRVGFASLSSASWDSLAGGAVAPTQLAVQRGQLCVLRSAFFPLCLKFMSSFGSVEFWFLMVFFHAWFWKVLYGSVVIGFIAQDCLNTVLCTPTPNIPIGELFSVGC